MDATKITHCALFIAICASVSVCAAGDTAAKSKVDITPPMHHEVHAAFMLQRMLQRDLDVSTKRKHAIDLAFAEFYRRVGEGLPRPVLLAYPVAQGSGISTETQDTIDVVRGQTIYGEVLKDASGKPVTLVDTLVAGMTPEEEARFRPILNRWVEIKPDPVDSLRFRLSRALRDPKIGAGDIQRRKMRELVRTKRVRSKGRATESWRNSDDAQAREVHKEMLELLNPSQRKRFANTMAELEEEIGTWRALKTGAVALYERAVKLLDAEKNAPSGSHGQ